MLIFLTNKATPEEIKSASVDLGGYIKFVVDINRNVLTIGGARHVEGEALLLSQGSNQTDLWGGGFDMETNEIDYDSMINIRPSDGNTSREVLSEPIRKKMKDIIAQFLL